MKDKKAIKDFESPANRCLYLWKGTSSVAISGRDNNGVHCQVCREGKGGVHPPVGCVETETEVSPKGRMMTLFEKPPERHPEERTEERSPASQ